MSTNTRFFKPRTHGQTSRSASASSASSLSSSESSGSGSANESESGTESNSDSDSDAHFDDKVGHRRLANRNGVPRSIPKLEQLYFDARASLEANTFDQLALTLKRITTLLSSSPAFTTSSVWVPILDRFARDVRDTLARPEWASRESRRNSTLSSPSARALVSLRQNLAQLDWVQRVHRLVSSNSPPSFLSGSPSRPLDTRALLSSVERLVSCTASSARLRFNLSNLDLTDDDLARWTALEHLDRVVEWYLSFSPTSRNRPEQVLARVSCLNLSHNRLSSFPSWLPNLFPHLESLSLARNQFHHLPPWTILFRNLTRLKVHHNPLSRASTSTRDRTQRKRSTQSNTRIVIDQLALSNHDNNYDQQPTVRSLFSICIELVQRHQMLPRSPSNLDEDDPSYHLEHHFEETVRQSYLCQSCRRFILAPSATPTTGTSRDENWMRDSLFERMQFVSPGIVLPKALLLHQPDRVSERSLRADRTCIEHESRDERLADQPPAASLDQLILLTLYDRNDQAASRSTPRPHTVPSSSSQASTVRNHHPASVTVNIVQETFFQTNDLNPPRFFSTRNENGGIAK
ncbi:uncharacterized protein JCM15063_005944 [Sporobolomyces koalae]|uniref:uncharacterized protein n=1 Tax=Sporobolomyces koalae TaxID=500713 RepID=UPI00317E0EC8